MFNPTFDDFKKWMESKNAEQPKQESVQIVQSKIDPRKLLKKIDICEGVEKIVCKDFFANGGIIKEEEGKNYLIEVSTGSFYIAKIYVE